MRKGYLQVYTGNGKGKTTASLGLCLRSLANGFRIFYMQFMKDGSSSEFESLAKLGGNFVFKACGNGSFIMKSPSISDIQSAEKGLADSLAAVSSGEYDLVVMDEANGAVAAGLLKVEKLLELIAARSESTELVITGRSAHESVIEAADLVTEMKEVKHYMKKGVKARKGIEL